MKKIKKKRSLKRKNTLPAFVIGYSHTEAPPPGYVAAWFNQLYGGPLDIRFGHESAHSTFEAFHTQWGVAVDPALSTKSTDAWKQQLHWSHSHVAEVTPLPSVGSDKRDIALHTARIARGITLLTDGTAYDLVSHSFLNPSDWKDIPLDQFWLEDHLNVAQGENLESGQKWFYSLGLAKFGLEEIEAFRPIGLPDQLAIESLLNISREILARGRAIKVGDEFSLSDSGQFVTIVRHRTDQSTGRLLQLREVQWNENG